jgi:hypothetical protein
LLEHFQVLWYLGDGSGLNFVYNEIQPTLIPILREVLGVFLKREYLVLDKLVGQYTFLEGFLRVIPSDVLHVLVVVLEPDQLLPAIVPLLVFKQ